MNKKLLIAASLIVCVTISIFAALWLNASAQLPIPGCTVYVSPYETTVRPCQNFVIDVKISGVPPDIPITDYEFFLDFDSTQVSLIPPPVDGGFLMPPLIVFFWEIIDNPGVLDTIHVQAVSGDGGAIGAGTLTTMTFHCDAEGVSMLFLWSVILSSGSKYYVPGNPLISGNVYQTNTLTYIDPPTYTVPICIPFPVYVKVKDVTDLYSYKLVLSYNTLYADCIDIVDGGFLPPPTQVIHKLIDDGAGRIEFDVTSLAGAGVTGSGTIAKITFHCRGAGESILNLDSVKLLNSLGTPIPTHLAGGRVIQVAYWEPTKLMHIVEWPYPYALVDIPFVPPGSPPGYAEIKRTLEDKGFMFDPAYGGTAMNVTLFIEGEEIQGNVTSWWSSNTLSDGTRACMLSWGGKFGVAEPTFMVMGFVTNLLPPEQVPGVDPYIIVNAMPYMYLRFYWWTWPSDHDPLGHLVTWPYWWYDSHSHPNWFWGPYWWWRTYTKAYYYPYTDVPYWQPWWGWWWHWTYRTHWYWWSTYFPYDP